MRSLLKFYAVNAIVLCRLFLFSLKFGVVIIKHIGCFTSLMDDTFLLQIYFLNVVIYKILESVTFVNSFRMEQGQFVFLKKRNQHSQHHNS